MDLQFDHIIHYMDQPEQGMEELNKCGIHAVDGGSHEKRGSYNTLSYFGLSYIELLGINNKEIFTSSGAAKLAYSPFESIAKDNFREGFAKINLRTKNLEQLKRKLTNHGIKTNGPIPLSRRKPDGTLLEWELLYAGGHPGELPLPFFIDWGVSDEERCESLKQDGTIAAHPAGNLSLTSILFVVKDAKETAALWRTLFELEQGKAYLDDELHAECYPLKLGEVTFIFASPTGVGDISRALAEKGEHPYLVTIEGADESSAFNLFGARYQLNLSNSQKN
ncbi:VOC family protein [bacterium LRH843]|nr:VOC family protein [bacterium LRH843]